MITQVFKPIMWVSTFFILFAISNCSGRVVDNKLSLTPIPNASVGGCFIERYPNPSASEYILPFNAGKSFLVNQGNCGRFTTHRPICTAIAANGKTINCGDGRYAYDFFMPIGTEILAARSGIVINTEDRFSNSTNAAYETNYVVIQHDDYTIAQYLHLSPNSLRVSYGDTVSQGEPIALSGSSGFTDPPGVSNPHLHFDVLKPPFTYCGNGVFSGCRSVPVTFKNAKPLDVPLIEDSTYEALPN